MIHPLHPVEALFLEPGRRFERRNHGRPRALRYLGNVGDVIAVAMRHQDEIRLDLLNIDLFRQRIGLYERVKEQLLPARHDREAGVSVIGKFHGDIY
jgi:hypothetical protein